MKNLMLDAIATVNRRIATLDNGDSIRYLDPGRAFLGPNGEIDREMIPDLLHPVAAGFRVFGSLIRPMLDAMMD